MTVRIVIVDDDVSVRKIIRNIIEKHQLGVVVAECEDGGQAEKVIAECRPDIALVDLLLPVQDGIQLIAKIRARFTDTDFIMISQASSESLITQAYSTGIEFFIHKPINVLEIVSIINKVKDNRNLRQAMSVISQTTAKYSSMASPEGERGSDVQKTRIYKVFSDLGIIGEAGTNDIYNMGQLLEKYVRSGSKYQLAEQYQLLSVKLNQDTKAIEQRIRRTIIKALHNLSNVGIEDYYDDNFQMYSTALFDFKEVRHEMDYIKGKNQYRGKVNVKKFLEGLLFITEIRN